MSGKIGRVALFVGALLSAQGAVLAQPSGGFTLKCVPISRCVSPLGGPKIGTSIRPVNRLVIVLPAGAVGRTVNMQFIADSRGMMNVIQPNLVFLNSKRFGKSASRMNTLINYRCVQGSVKGKEASYICRLVK